MNKVKIENVLPKLKYLLFVLVLFLHTKKFGQTDDKTKYVNVMIGTQGEGNTFPGVALPFSMLKLGPDCDDLTSNSGYKADGLIKGFSHTHVSGTGGGPKYGNILVTPITGSIDLKHRASSGNKEASIPGKYSVKLSKYNINANLTGSHSVGFHKYEFPKSRDSKILIDLGSFLETSWCEGCSEEQELVGSAIEIVNDTLIEGYTRVRKGWNTGSAYTVYFSLLVDRKAQSYGTWKNDKLMKGIKHQSDSGESSGAWLQFDTTENQTIQVKVGISFIGTLKARENIGNEIPHWNFNKVYQKAKQKWNNYLNKIDVTTDQEDLKIMFYTALYHSLLQPTNRTSENPLWNSTEPYYDDFYAIWDTFRATHPLFIFLCPDEQRDMINALLDIYKVEAFMPDARSGNFTGRTQGGSNCDVLIADALIKGLENIDYNVALNAMIANAESDPGVDHRLKGRGGLNEYNTVGYVSTNHERAGTRTVEYAYNDFCIYQVAKKIDKSNLAATYLKRSSNWKNLWKPIESEGSFGFIMPKKDNGEWDEAYEGRAWDGLENKWKKADFTVHTHGTWPDFFYEADSWEYSFYVPHDVYGLIEHCGGKSQFIKRLDTFFNNNYYNVGNEPSFLTPTYYNYVGRQDKTLETVRSIIINNYNTSSSGIPGNDDSGSMSSWLAFHLIGFYPNAGQDLYLITAPHFDKVIIKLNSSSSLEIKTTNLSKKNIYIQKVLFNGIELKGAWFRHSEIKNGGKLEFFMGEKPTNDWEKAMPPNGY